MNTVSGKSRIEKRLRMFAVALCFCRIGNLFSKIKKFKKLRPPLTCSWVVMIESIHQYKHYSIFVKVYYNIEREIVMILPAEVELNKEKLVFTKPGDTEKLVAAVMPEYALIKDVTWSSSDESVAKVDGKGVVTAMGMGEADIMVTTASPYHNVAVCRVIVAEVYGFIWGGLQDERAL